MHAFDLFSTFTQTSAPLLQTDEKLKLKHTRLWDRDARLAGAKSTGCISEHTTKQLPKQEHLYLSPEHTHPAFLQTRAQSEKYRNQKSHYTRVTPVCTLSDQLKHKRTAKLFHDPNCSYLSHARAPTPIRPHCGCVWYKSSLFVVIIPYIKGMNDESGCFLSDFSPEKLKYVPVHIYPGS